MKKLAIVALGCLFAFGCTDYKSQVETLKKERQELIAHSTYKDSTITDFVASINEIEKNINEITEKQKLVSANTNGELKSDAKSRILSNINEIDKLLQDNKHKIAELAHKLKSSSLQVSAFEKMLASLNEQLSVKDTEMAQLNEKISNLNTSVTSLNSEVDNLNQVTAEKSKTIDDQTNKLQTAYYAKGTYKELKTKAVVEKNGGFLGLGKSEVLKNDFDRSAFTPINIMKVTDIPISSKDVELLTVHPSDSYTLKKDEKDVVSDLVITDPEKFWSTSKYLVVLVDK